MSAEASVLSRKLRRAGVARSPLAETDLIVESLARGIEDRLRPIVKTMVGVSVDRVAVVKLAGATAGIAAPAMMGVIEVEDADTPALVACDAALANHLIDLPGELRTLEYSQRLRDRARAILAEPGRSTGRVLYEAGLDGGATAAGRGTGAIREGLWADLCAVSLDNPVLFAREGDEMLDSLIFAGGEGLVRDVWAAGRHMVRDGRHVEHDGITADYLACLARLQERM